VALTPRVLVLMLLLLLAVSPCLVSARRGSSPDSDAPRQPQPGPIPTPTPDGFKVHIDGAWVGVAVSSSASFRLSVWYEGNEVAAQTSPMLQKQPTLPSFVPVSNGSVHGLRTSFGTLQLDVDTGSWELLDARSKRITGSRHAGQANANNSYVLMELTAEPQEQFYGSGAS